MTSNGETSNERRWPLSAPPVPVRHRASPRLYHLHSEFKLP